MTEQLKSIETSAWRQNGSAIDLSEILAVVPDGEGLQWHVLNLWAVGTSDASDSILKIEDGANANPGGLRLSWHELLALCKRFTQIIDAIVIGYRSTISVSFDSNEDSFCKQCDCVIAVHDSSLLRLCGTNAEFIRRASQLLSKNS